jgi:BlaI family transcriptional regulator, penicillinase repressor
MARTPQDVTDTELAILQVLWDQGPCTRRQITDVLYPRGGPAQYATVQKLLERLEAKGFVTVRNRGQGVLTFAVSVDRDELISRKLQEMAEKLCGGSMTPLLMNLVRAQPLTDRQLAELRSFVENLRRQAKRKSERR